MELDAHARMAPGCVWYWWCNMYNNGKKRMKRLLYNLHNEVLEAAESRINTKCSLTIREGVSHLPYQNRYIRLFPHYT